MRTRPGESARGLLQDRSRSRVAALMVGLAWGLSAPGARGAGEERLYWTAVNEPAEPAIRRSGLDGSNAEDLITGIEGNLEGLALDPRTGHVYWIERNGVGSRILKADTDGIGRDPILTTGESLSRLDILPDEGALYFTVTSPSEEAGIRRIDLGSREVVPVVRAEVHDMAVDDVDGRVYWVQEGAPGVWGTDIWRAGLDGSSPEPVIHHPFEHHTTGIAIDRRGGKIYWGTIDYLEGGVQVIERANLDGTEMEPVARANPGLDDWPVFLDLELRDRKVYWVNGEDGEFYRAPLAGGEAEFLFADPGPFGPFDIAIARIPDAGDFPPFRRGDSNGDGTFDVTDPVFTLGWLFLGTGEPPCGDAADANDDGRIDIADAIESLSYLFLGTGDIPSPGPSVCGPDPTPDDGLGCGAFPTCPF